MPAIEAIAARITELDAELETLQNADAPADVAEAEARSARIDEVLAEIKTKSAEIRRHNEIVEARANVPVARPVVSKTGMVAARSAETPARVPSGIKVARCFDDEAHAEIVGRHLVSLVRPEVRAVSSHPMGSVDTVAVDSMGEASPTYDGRGSELVTHELYRGIINEMGYNAIAGNLATMYAVNTDGLYIPIAAEAPLSQWYVENQEIIPMKPGTSRATLALKKMGTRVQVSSELLSDAYISVAQLVVSQIGQSFGRTLDSAYFKGDAGASITGVAAAIAAYNSGSNEITLATADTITKDELALAVNTVDQNARNRQWVVSPTGWSEIMGLAVDAIGSNVTNAVQAQVFGAPVTVSNYLPTGCHAIYGDFGMATALGYKPNGITVRASMERAIEFDQTVFVGTARYAFAPHSPQYLVSLVNPVV